MDTLCFDRTLPNSKKANKNGLSKQIGPSIEKLLSTRKIVVFSFALLLTHQCPAALVKDVAGSVNVGGYNPTLWSDILAIPYGRRQKQTYFKKELSKCSSDSESAFPSFYLE